MKATRPEQNPHYLPPKNDGPPLHCAARLGDHEAIRKLVNDGSDINQTFDLELDPSGRCLLATPLMVAAGSGYGANIETMQLLLKMGADSSRKIGPRSIARYAAAGLGWNYLPGGDAARLRFCLDLGCDANETDDRGVTLLADAVATGDIGRVKVLLETGARPNTSGVVIPTSSSSLKALGVRYRDDAPSSFQIPLHNAAEVDELEIVNALIQAGADIYAMDKGSETALFLARSPEVARVLVDCGLDVEARNWLNWTPLLNAIGDGSLNGVKALLSVDANVNATTDRGYTVFMSAVSSSERNLDIMKSLVEAGANPHAVSNLGWNAFHAAIDVNGADANKEETIRSTLELVKQLGVDINHKDVKGVSPLERAREHGTKIEVRALRELGARP